MLKNLALRHLRAFEAVARLGSFGHAAKELHVSQSALSQAVQHLEEMLEARLIDRSTRRVQLSLVGQELLPGIQRILRDLDHELQSLRDVQEFRRGHVIVSCLQTVATRLLPRVLTDFQERFPNVTVTLREGVLQDILGSVRSGQAELGIVNVLDDPPDLDVTPLTRDRFGLVMRRDHPLAVHDQIRWEQALASRMIAMSSGTGIRSEIDRKLSSILSATLQHEAQHPATLLAMAEAGVGVVPLPSLAWPLPDHPRLTARPLIQPIIERQLFVIKRNGRNLSPPARAFFQRLIECGAHWRAAA